MREHRALHQILLGGVCLYVCVRQPLIHCSYCDSQSVCYPKWLKAGKRYTEALRGYGYEDLKYLSLKIHQQLPHLSLDNLYTKTS